MKLYPGDEVYLYGFEFEGKETTRDGLVRGIRQDEDPVECCMEYCGWEIRPGRLCVEVEIYDVKKDIIIERKQTIWRSEKKSTIYNKVNYENVYICMRCVKRFI